MSESEKWTVVGSKSRTKKVNPPEKGEGSSNSKKNLENHGPHRQVWFGKNASSISNHTKNQSQVYLRQPDASISDRSTTRQRPVTTYKADIKNVSDTQHLGKKNVPQTLHALKSQGIRSSSTDLQKEHPNPSESRIKLLTQRTAQTKPSTPNVGFVSDKIQAVSQNSSKTKASTPSLLNVASTSTNLNDVSTDSTSGTVTVANKKKRLSKENRRKKREEKFYQALYQNKDSHIQFVSADVIRKIQNDPKVSSPKPCSSKDFPPHPITQPTLAQCFNSLQLQQDFENFPSLTPTNSYEKKRNVRLTSISESSTNETESPMNTSSHRPMTEENDHEKDRIIWPISKSLDEAHPETPTMKRNSISNPTPTSSSKGKKSKQPMIIDVSSLIVNKKKERDAHRKFLSLSRRSVALKKENFKVTAGNPLDSSGPGVINRGKIRQKKKKPTKLKLTILKSRALKKILIEEKNKQSLEKCHTNVVSQEDPPAFTEECNLESTRDNHSQREIADKDNAQQETQVDPDAMKNEDSRNNLCQYMEIKNEEAHNKINIISENDISLKFIQLLDEVSMMKIIDDMPSPEIEVSVKNSMHNRKFRDYCDMYTSKELHKLVMNLLSELFRFQDRLYHTDPIKFKTKRRFVSGLKEALCYLNLNKVQLLIIAPDIEKNPEPGGLDDKITQILTLAKGKNVPYVFSGSKYNLGKPVKIKTPLSIISVLDKQNCEETFRALLEEANQLREKYHNEFATKAKELKALEK